MDRGKKPKLIRAATVAMSLDTFCRGLLAELSADYEVVALSSPAPVLDELGEREGVRTVAIPMARQISPLADMRSLWRLYRAMRREKPDIVHSMTPKAGLLCMTAAWLARVPRRVHTFTGLIFPTSTGVRRRLLMLTDRITCACATHVIPEGEGVRADLTAAAITRKPMRVLGHGNVRGIDLQHFRRTDSVEKQAHDIRSGLALQPGDTVFVFIGRLVADKGIRELSEAFLSLPGTPHLILVGEAEPELDPLDNTTQDRIDACPRIHTVGLQSDVRPWLAAADALVLPSYREGFPNVVIEAGAMGLPCIVTDINGSREIISDGHNGIIVPTHDALSLARAMDRLATDKSMREQMAANARPGIETRFEQGYVRGCLKQFYREIITPSCTENT